MDDDLQDGQRSRLTTEELAALVMRRLETLLGLPRPKRSSSRSAAPLIESPRRWGLVSRAVGALIDGSSGCRPRSRPAIPRVPRASKRKRPQRFIRLPS